MNDSAKWRMHLLGGFSLSRDGQASEIPLGLKERALLAYLILHPNRRETRQKLATLLWGNISEESAHHSLNESLSKLRKAHEDHERKIFANQGDYIVVDSASFSVDAIEFALLAKKSDRESLESAEAQYAGDLLDGLDIRTEGFEEWLRIERTRLEDLSVAASIKLMELRAAAGEMDRAADMAHRLLRRDPGCEEAHRLLMRQHWTAKRWKAAFEQYQACERALNESHGIPPSPETRQLMAEIRGAYQQTGDRTAEPLAKIATPNVTSPQQRALPSHGLAHGRHSVRRLVQRLIGAVVALTLILALAISYLVWSHWRIPELAPPWLGEIILAIKGPIAAEPPSIVVLPFKGTGDDAARADAYADAIAEGISGALAKASEMFVVAQSSAQVYEGKTETVSQIAQELGVRYVLEGSLQQFGGRVTIHVGLIDTEQGGHRLWTESFEGTAEDFYDLQRSITLDVITSLEVRLTSGETERINLAHGTRDLDAWLTAAAAYKLLRRLTPDDNRKARDLYLRAIEQDPDYSGAWEGLGWTHFIDAKFGWSPSFEQSLAEAERHARKVLSLDDTRPRAYSLKGGIELLKRDYDAALELGERAVRLESNDADAAFFLGYTLTFTGEPQRAIVLLKRAIRLTPYEPGLYHLVLGRAHRLAGYHKEAAAILEQITAVDSRSYIPYVELAATYTELGATGKAKAAAETVMRLNPDFKVGLWVRFPAFRDDATTAHEIEILHSAGLPE